VTTRKTPRIAHSELTGRWYIVTSYEVDQGGRDMVTAHKKHDVTDALTALLTEAGWTPPDDGDHS
jgi:hypothetical protein